MECLHYVRAWDKLYITFQPMEGNPYMYLNRTRAHARLVLPLILMLALALVMHATPALADEAIEPVSDIIVDSSTEDATSDEGDVVVDTDEDAVVPDDDMVPTDEDVQAETTDPAAEATTVPDDERDDVTVTDSVETAEPVETADETPTAPAEELLSAAAPVDDTADTSDTTDPEPDPEPEPEPEATGRWWVGNLGNGLQRYWLVDDVPVVDQLIDLGDGTFAYARPEGYVVRGRWRDPRTGYVYLADNNGVLLKTGWSVSKSFGQGTQRYYVDPVAHACVPGYSKDGWQHYTTTSGYVARGSFKDADGMTSYANANGLVTGYFPARLNGWVVTNAYGQGTQRYWLANGLATRGKLIQTGSSSWAYARPEGYVVRGRWADPKTGYVYLANNNGRLEAAGWHVTNAYGQGTQRYYVDATAHACVPGYSGTGFDHCTRPEGYVVRGLWANPDTCLVYLANNNGRLETAGWHVTNAYGQGTKRYYVDATEHACVPGYSTDGWAHFTCVKGYVLCNSCVIYKGNTYRTDSAGRSTSVKLTDPSVARRTWVYVPETRSMPEGQLGAFTGRMIHYTEYLDIGYSQGDHRYDVWDGGQTDCSALVVTCLRQAGFEVGSANTTSDLRRNLVANGWEVLPWAIGNVRAGDILLCDGYHTCAVVSGSGRTALIAEAWINEQGGIVYGRPGDQTKKETRVRQVYQYPVGGGWKCILRYTA